MGRRRVQHELISKESVRKVTFKKRRAGLKKKLSELTTLCGVTACAIICASFDHQPEIWPSPAEAARLLDKFNNFPIKRRGKYMMDQNTFLSKKISNLFERMRKERKKNRGLEMDLMFTQCLAGKDMNNFDCLEDLKDLDHLLKEKIKVIADKIECEMGLKSNPANTDGHNIRRTKGG
ncbi:hypothetical protein WN944_008500 [Citrus x changshan-huyou]|uniref:MADS-box domain-containing protein n=1 Tax=Citrus x changshan-huyou TaxID=2935761 RepID=A0AAP0MN14_9ROSI